MSSDTPRILVIDIESRPALSYHWGQWKQNIPNQMIVEPVSMLCFAYKWVGEKGTGFHSILEGQEAQAQAAWDLLNEADAVVTYNGDGYDIPHLNREFALAGLGPTSPFISVDLYKAAKQMKWFSHKLDYVADQLTLGRKLATGGFELWLGVMAGDPKAWRKMERYNRRDVVVTDHLRRELLPWLKKYPNMNLFRHEDEPLDCCPKCSSTTLEKRGFRLTNIGKYQRYQCKTCGAWSSEGKRVVGADIR